MEALSLVKLEMSLTSFEGRMLDQWDVGDIELLSFQNEEGIVKVTDYLLVEDSTWYWWQDGTVERSRDMVEALLKEHFKGVRILWPTPNYDYQAVEVYAYVWWEVAC